jgi:hypothetical protein
MRLKIYHYSASPIKKIVQKHYYAYDRVPWEEMNVIAKNSKSPGKPIGFWLSAGTAWERWCKSNDFESFRLRYQYRIKLRKNHNVLMIHDLVGFDKFCYEYGYDPYGIYSNHSEKTKELFGESEAGQRLATYWHIRKYYPDCRWNLVKEKYQGIIICPYFHNRRLMTSHSQWYYGWDCASGCIWDVDCIKSFELEKKNKVKRVKKPDYSELVSFNLLGKGALGGNLDNESTKTPQSLGVLQQQETLVENPSS